MIKMPTKSQLEYKIKSLNGTINGLRSNLSQIYTEILKISIKKKYKDIIDYLNPNPEELREISKLIDLEDIDEALTEINDVVIMGRKPLNIDIDKAVELYTKKGMGLNRVLNFINEDAKNDPRFDVVKSPGTLRKYLIDAGVIMRKMKNVKE